MPSFDVSKSASLSRNSMNSSLFASVTALDDPPSTRSRLRTAPNADSSTENVSSRPPTSMSRSCDSDFSSVSSSHPRSTRLSGSPQTCLSRHRFKCASRCAPSSKALPTSFPAKVSHWGPRSAWPTVASSCTVYVRSAPPSAVRKRPNSVAKICDVARRKTSRPTPPASRPGSPANLKKKGQRHWSSRRPPSASKQSWRSVGPRVTTGDTRPVCQGIRSASSVDRSAATRRAKGHDPESSRSRRVAASAAPTAQPTRASTSSRRPRASKRRTNWRPSASSRAHDTQPAPAASSQAKERPRRALRVFQESRGE
mmetsp:Transcript_20581/g.67987  ORF Transcript_20581/g.67987 Transcript_20581/m.67987 type:complete len:312 (+) Transcript_20581:165-1100(+)